ncbi:efflux RND transporter permease subunit [Vibrio campbellii]|uniref:Efflux pump membrane transporter n=1 Tax=Vibrio campbellii TaxID=680 RepID=A0ABY5IMN8_9VIBR|nr:efflux RND transporter permease subunit [Vibrio campbellii]UTZ23722.1 efflux RND transporter permease subunit [Vibrio campbellii]UTZ34141.1 efflux RND transporter permease subunit [Vibrio campbellii]
MAKFFIDKPVFAWVIAILIMLSGALSITKLPISQYPSIAPPTVMITTRYNGASAKTVEDSVTQVIEQSITGIDNLRYLSSASDSSGNVEITITFEGGTDPDVAQVQVQNKLQSALPLLPLEVQQQGVKVSKASSNILMIVGLYSKDGSLDKNDISDFVFSKMSEPLSRVRGVGDIQVFGAPYAMRIWLDPFKLEKYNLASSDVVNAIKQQNVQVSAGQFGTTPMEQDTQINAVISAQSRLSSAKEFQKIVVKSDSTGAQVTLKDIARVELGADDYIMKNFYNGYPAAALGIKLATGANAIQTAEAVKKAVDELRPFFPDGLEVVYPYDTSPFVEKSIEGVVHTLFEAVLLVFFVMYLFLQNLRATLIPTIAVPVVLLGTFAVLYSFGLSINMLTMFAMILAIGLLVDDAIVVVENVERIMHEENLSPREATHKSMGQISSALVGIALTLSAVFVPMAFMSGSTGVIYRQFSITIITAMALSVIVALILTPALCATMLKPVNKESQPNKFFACFNRMFDAFTGNYERTVSFMLNRTIRVMLLFVVISAAGAWYFTTLPTAFLPDEDQGILFAQVVLPSNSTQEQTEREMEKVEKYFLEQESDVVENVFTASGFSFAGTGNNMGVAFIGLKDWKEREKPGTDVKSVVARSMQYFSTMRDSIAVSFAPPAAIELGTATGFSFYLEDRGAHGHEALLNARDDLIRLAQNNKNLVGVRPNGQEDSSIYQLDIDMQKVLSFGLSMDDVNSVLSTAFGGTYVNDFLDQGRVKKVYVQSDEEYRLSPSNIGLWYVKNSNGEMISLNSFVSGHWEKGSPRLERFNGVSAVNIQGGVIDGYSTGDAMRDIEALSKQLPPGFSIAWNGLSYEEKQSGSQAPLLYVLSVLIVFLVLAALYESWSVPFSVLLVIPLGVIGTLAAVGVRGMANDVFFQVGLLTTVGLATKNAILIIEFAKEKYTQGCSIVEATLDAVRSRIRPIIMTSLAFGLGVLPLAISHGVSSGAKTVLGTSVLGGMMSSTFLGVFFVPVFFIVVERCFGRQTK